jgi:HNH endonuclease
LAERGVRNAEVRGSIPLCSINENSRFQAAVFILLDEDCDIILFMSRPKNPRHCRTCQRPVNNYCAVYCCNACQLQAQYEAYIKRWKVGDESGVAGAAGISRYIRRYLTERHGERCLRCGWQERHPVTGKVPLTIDHIDGDCLNNAPSNLRLLCPNCHSLTPNYGNLNKGRSQRYYRRAQATMRRILKDST